MVLILGLGLSMALMGVAASFIACLLQKHHWIAYVGLAVILYVGFEMIYRGAVEVRPAIAATWSNDLNAWPDQNEVRTFIFRAPIQRCSCS